MNWKTTDKINETGFYLYRSPKDFIIDSKITYIDTNGLGDWFVNDYHNKHEQGLTCPAYNKFVFYGPINSD
jgi:hypothetical protein